MKPMSRPIAVLGLVLISNLCHFECQPVAGLPAAKQQQQQRQIGPSQATSTNSSSSSAGRIAAILAAKPRPGSANSSHATANLQQQDLARLRKAEALVKSDSESAGANGPRASAVVAPKVATGPKPKSQVGKRQVDFADQSNRPSRRNEDEWFLDQAPLPLQPYRFNYNVKDKNGLTEQYRQEAGDGKFLTGSYGYVLPDGIFRHVDYVADDRGFRAFIRTSEPGTANQNPADVVINSSPVPGVSYAATSPGFTSGLQPLAGVQPRPQTSWNDNNWNYSALGLTNQFGPTSSSLRNQLDNTLTRRAPGSIVGTPLRNFSSLAYPLTTFGHSPLDLAAPPSSSWGSLDPPPPQTNNFHSLARFGDLARLQPIGTSNLTTSLNAGPGGEQFQTHLTEGKQLEGAHQQLLSKARDQLAASLTSGQQVDNQARNSNSLAQLPPFYHQRPGLLLPSRVGPDVLLYDRPFGIQQGDGGDSHKLTYNYNHILGAADSAAQKADDRARNSAYLERLRTLSRLYATPDLVPPNELALIDYAQNRPPSANVTTGDRAHQPSSSGGSVTKTSSHSEHHQELKSTSQLVGDLNRVTLTREHKSGFSLGSGLDSRQSFGPELPGTSQPSGQSSPATPQPPPQPQFSSSGPGQQRWPAQTKGQLARLVAPYADEHQFGAKGGAKGGHQSQETTQQFADDTSQQQRQLGSTTASLPVTQPDEPRGPADTSPERERASSVRPVDESDQSRTTTKTAGQQVVRTVRMPEDFRTSMLMNDLRSMQNALGLPQPPRLQRSSSPTGADGDGPQRFGAGPGNLAEQLVLARMARVESLLRDGAATSPATQQQASVQQAVAVPAGKPAARQLEDEGNKLNRSLSPNGPRPSASDNEVEDDQPRRSAPGSKPSLKSHIGAGDQRHRQQSNESLAQFEAQRLNNNRARLRADKVSELEKFQQRLKTQQLLLEQIKSNEKKAAQGKQLVAEHAAGKQNEANSHVKYDEPQENEPVRSGTLEANGKSATFGDRPGQPNESELAVSRARKHTEASSGSGAQPAANRTHKESDYARQLQQWPSVSAGIERQRVGLGASSNRSSESDAAKPGINPVRAHKMELPKQEDKSQTADRANQTGRSGATSPNTINLDFINSVTALSMDQFNPFAISSVNPAIQRASNANSERLSPHRLALPLTGVQQLTPSQLTSGPNLLATAPARYFSSNELLAALDHHERQDSGQRMRNLLGLNPVEQPMNHRQASGEQAHHYTTQAQLPEPTLLARPFDGLLGAKFIVTPSSSGQGMAAMANSQHKSIAPKPQPARETRQSGATSPKPIEDNHRVDYKERGQATYANNHRFYEIVSGGPMNSDSVSLRAQWSSLDELEQK